MLLFIVGTAQASFRLAEPRLRSSDRIWSSTVAANANGFLPLWHYGAQADIASRPIDEHGRPVTPSGVGVFGPDVMVSGAPAIGALGDDFLLQTLVYREGERVRSQFFRVGADGRAESEWSAAGVPLERYLLGATTPTGDRILLIPIEWNDAQALILDGHGTVIRSVPLPFRRDALARVAPVASAEGEFVFAWWDDAALYVQRVAADGSEAAPVTTVATGERSNEGPAFATAAVATSGAEILVVYGVRHTDPQSSMRVASVSPEGEVTSAESFRLPAPWTHPSRDLYQWRFTLRWAGDHYVLFAPNFESSALSGIRLSRSGTPLDAAPVDVHPSGAHDSQIANRGDRFYVAALDQFGSIRGIVGSTFVTTGGIRDVTHELLSITPADQTAPRVASDGASFLSIWNERFLSGSELRGTLFSANGEKATLELPRPGNSALHDVEYAAGVYAVVWTVRGAGGDTIYATRVTPGGAVLDDAPIVVADSLPNPEQIAISSNGSRFLVVWSTRDRFQAVPLSASGVVGPRRDLRGHAPLPSTVRIVEFDVASDGENFVVLWTVSQAQAGMFPYETWTAEAVPVDADGVPLEVRSIGDHAAGPLVWDGRDFVHAVRSGPLTVSLRKMDALARPSGSERSVNVPADARILDLVARGDELDLAYATDERPGLARHHVLRVGAAAQQFLVGGPTTVQSWNSMQLIANAAGEVLAVVSELGQDGKGARSLRATVHRLDELVPIAGRRRAVRR